MEISSLFVNMMVFVTQYFLLFVFIFGFVLIDSGTVYFDNLIIKTMEEIDQEKEDSFKQFLQAEKTNRKRKLTTYDHTGFAFAGAAGHDVLITDNL